MPQNSFGWRESLSFRPMVVAIVACLLGAAAETDAGDDPRGRVIYNLDCTEYFMGTFGPIVPETIDEWVDAHAAAGITDLLVNVNAQRANYRSDVWEAHWDGYDPSKGVDQPFFLRELLQGGSQVPTPTSPRCSKTCWRCTRRDATTRGAC